MKLVLASKLGRGHSSALSSPHSHTLLWALHRHRLIRGAPPYLCGALCAQDAAWASFALLKNANICGLVAVWEGQAVLARGLVGLPSGAAVKPGDAAAALAALTQVRRLGARQGFQAFVCSLSHGIH